MGIPFPCFFSTLFSLFSLGGTVLAELSDGGGGRQFFFVFTINMDDLGRLM